MSTRIVIVGGGSAGWGPKLMSDLFLTPALADATYVLHDLNETNLQRIARFATKLASQMGISPRLVTEMDPDKAYADADFVLITISTGGLDAMAHDLAIPEDYQIYHTVGDTVGPGGWARTLRNVPVFQTIAQRVNSMAPNAVVLNYSNPMAQLTKTLSLHTAQPVVGLCHGLFETLGFIQFLLDIPDEHDIQAIYGGVNHFFWITDLQIRGRDGYALLDEYLNGRSLVEAATAVNPDLAHRVTLASELLRVTGMLTYAADRHTSEFFSHILTSPERMKDYNVVRTSIADRRQTLRETEREIEAMIAGEIPAEYHQRSRETAADIINAFVTGKPFVDVGNTPNMGQISNLPLGAVVETPVLVTPSGFQAVTVGELPEPTATWLDRTVRVQEMTTDAAIDGDLDLALMALALDPLCAHLDWKQVEELGVRLLRANAAYLPQFQGQL
ncbi:MAG: hypothetical protein ABFD20_05280 [Anaerolineales bacterium]